jgi:hypothetical protein
VFFFEVRTDFLKWNSGFKVAKVCSESHCALRLRYVDFVVSIEVAVEVCCYFTVFG